MKDSKSLWKERKEPTNQTASSSSSRTQPPEEFFPPGRERVSIPQLEDEDETGQRSGKEGEDLIVKQIQKEKGQEEIPVQDVEKRKIKVATKTQLIFEIPLPTTEP